MKTISFKTNIKCAGCVATVTPFLNKTVGEGRWEVDTQSPDKVLTVNTENTTVDAIKASLQQAGYKAELLA